MKRFITHIGTNDAKMAMELGAPLDWSYKKGQWTFQDTIVTDDGDFDEVFFEIPTFEEMIGWLFTCGYMLDIHRRNHNEHSWSFDFRVLRYGKPVTETMNALIYGNAVSFGIHHALIHLKNNSQPIN